MDIDEAMERLDDYRTAYAITKARIAELEAELAERTRERDEHAKWRMALADKLNDSEMEHAAERERNSNNIAGAALELAAERERQEAALRVVNEQACDEGLWFRAQHVTEDYLQVALRRLHAAIEVGEK